MIRAPIRLACVLSLAALCGLRADPTAFTWSGALSSDANTVGNWTVDGVPAAAAPTAADTLIFGAASRANLIFTAGSAVAKVVIGGSAAGVGG